MNLDYIVKIEEKNEKDFKKAADVLALFFRDLCKLPEFSQKEIEKLSSNFSRMI